MISAEHALELAGRRQRRALRDAAGFAAVLGEPVGFLRRAVPGGAVFEAVALASARTCAIVDERGALRLAPAAAAGEPRDRVAAVEAPPVPRAVAMPRFGATSPAAAERALAAAARPAPRGA